MAKIKQIGMAAGTFSVALGIGFVMQNGDALASRFGADNTAEAPATFAAEPPVVEASLEVPSEAEASVAPIQPVQSTVAFSAEPVIATPQNDPEDLVALPEAEQAPVEAPAPVQLAHADLDLTPEIQTDAIEETSVESDMDCVPTMVAVPGSAATVALAISAPCHTDTAFTIHHQGMMFTAMTDADGVTKMTVPALAEIAVMIAAFDDGDGAVSTIVVPDFADYERAVLQWQGNTSVMLSAYEGDADYGGPNHIHASNPGDIDRLATSEGGFLMRLGNEAAPDALMAEVYTFPTGQIGVGPDVMLVAEAEITADNCGQELNAQSIQVSAAGAPSALDLTLVMPECDAVGDFLILQNMFQDLTLASR